MLLFTFVLSTFFWIIGESSCMSLWKEEVLFVLSKLGFFRFKIFSSQFQFVKSAGVSVFAHFLAIILNRLIFIKIESFCFKPLITNLVLQ